MLRSAMIAGVIALGCCVGVSEPAHAQMRGFHGNFGGSGGGRFFDGRGFDHRFDHRGFFHRDRFFGRDRFFFDFGFPGFGFAGYPYYPAYYYPPYYPYYPYPYYPPYPGYAGPAAYSSGTVTPGAASAVDYGTVREVQAELQRQGYDVGPVDGRLGPRTKAAIRQYEQQNGLPVDGLPSRSLRDHMQVHPAG